MIELKEISLGFADKQLAEGISARLDKGKFVAIVGDNGSGKSTLLKCIMGEESPRSGEILLNNQSINKLDRRTMASQISVNLSGRTSIPGMTVMEVLETATYPLKGRFSEEDVKTKLNEIIETYGLDEFEGRLINTLSDGEYQRSMIARSFVQSTPFILMDEPSAFLDVRRKRELFRSLSIAAKADMGILISSHDIHEVLEFCTHVWILNGGKLVEYNREDSNLKETVRSIFAMDI